MRNASLVLRKVFASLIALSAAFASQAALAQDYPTKPIRLVVPFPAGGAVDTVARLVAQRISDSVKQPVIVDNIGGASGALAHEAIARAAPDGYTLIMATASTIATNPLVNKVSFDPLRDFTAVSMVLLDPLALVAHPSVPAKNVRELIALAKEKPGSLNMASFGTGSISHLAGELFNAAAGTKMVHVPYKGGAPAMNDLIGGHVSLMFNSVGIVGAPSAAGQIRLLAVGSRQRSSGFPDVPTIAEAGLPEYEASTWMGVFGPGNLPKPIVDRLSAEVAAALKQPDLRERISKLGFEVRDGSASELDETLRRDVAKWTRIVRDANIRAD